MNPKKIAIALISIVVIIAAVVMTVKQGSSGDEGFQGDPNIKVNMVTVDPPYEPLVTTTGELDKAKRLEGNERYEINGKAYTRAVTCESCKKVIPAPDDAPETAICPLCKKPVFPEMAAGN